MAWIIKYTESAQRQLRKLDHPIAVRILDYMDERIALLDDPRTAGKNLVGPQLGSYWRYRVGDIRIICAIEDDQLCVLVIEIGNRRDIYRK